MVKKFTSLLQTFFIPSYCNLTLASNWNELRTFGGIAQILNPIVAGYAANEENGLGHFGIFYGQSFVTMGSLKLLGKSNKWEISKRPTRLKKKDRFNGFPSDPTTSAWTAAAYNRIFSEGHNSLTIPMYFAAALTGYSRT